MSTSIEKFIHEVPFPCNAGKEGEVRTAPITTHFSLSHVCIDHRLGM